METIKKLFITHLVLLTLKLILIHITCYTTVMTLYLAANRKEWEPAAKQQQQWCPTRKALLGNIPMLNAFQLWSLIPYLSPEDATTIEDFELSELAEDYYVETINLRYGKLENKNHLFDVFAKFSGYEDSTYTRLDMLTFVAENTA